MYSWFFQANYMSFTAGGTGTEGPQGVTGLQGVTGVAGSTGYSPYVPGAVVIPPYATEDLDCFPTGTSKITTYRLHLDNTDKVASATVDLLETPTGVRHNSYAELGTLNIFRTHSGVTGSLTCLRVENRTALDLSVTFLKTSV